MIRHLTVLILVFSLILAFAAPSFAAKNKTFSIHEKMFENMNSEFEVMGEVTLKPGEEKSFSTYSYKPVTIDFKTDLTAKKAKKSRHEGIGIKKLTSIKYYLKDPMGASMDVLPSDGMVKVSLKNFEKFPITVKLYKVHTL